MSVFERTKKGHVRAAVVRAWAILLLVYAVDILPNAGAEFHWGTSGGGAQDDDARKVGVDSSGNAYIVGDFVRPASFGAHTLAAVEEPDRWGGGYPYLAKIGPTGEYVWVAPIESATAEGALDLAPRLVQDELVGDLAVTPAGEAYVATRFYGTARSGTHIFESDGTDWDRFHGF